MAVCVRRWHDPAEKVHDRNLFVEKTLTRLSLNRKFIAMLKPDDGIPGRIQVDVLTLGNKSPIRVFGKNMHARDCIWRAIRLVPVVPKNSHVPIPRSKTPVKRVGDQVLLVLLPNCDIQFIRLSNISQEPPLEIQQKPEDLICVFSPSFSDGLLQPHRDNSLECTVCNLGCSTLLKFLRDKHGLPTKAQCTYEVQMHKFAFDVDIFFLTICEIGDDKAMKMVALVKGTINSKGVYITNVRKLMPDEICSVTDMQVEGGFLFALFSPYNVGIWTLSYSFALVGIIDVKEAIRNRGLPDKHLNYNAPEFSEDEKQVDHDRSNVDSMSFDEISVSPDCASVGILTSMLDGQAKKTQRIYVINIDEYFRANPSECNWDQLCLVSPSWAVHGICEGWHDIFAEGRPLFARAKQIELGADSTLKPFQKNLASAGSFYKSSMDTDDIATSSKPGSVNTTGDQGISRLLFKDDKNPMILDDEVKYSRQFLKANRLEITPRSLHWYNRRKHKSKPCGLHINVAMSSIDAVSLRAAESKPLLGEKDKLLQSIDGGNGYGGFGLDVVYGVPSGVGVRVKYGDSGSALPEILPPWQKKSAFVAQKEPSATKLNSMIKPEFASLNGFTLTAKRPTYADSKYTKQKVDKIDAESFSLANESKRRPATLNKPRCIEHYSLDRAVVHGKTRESKVRVNSFAVTSEMVVVEAENMLDNGGVNSTLKVNGDDVFVTRFSRRTKWQNDPNPFSVRLPSRFCSILQHHNSWFYLNDSGLYAFILPEGQHKPFKDYTQSTSLEGTMEQRCLIDCLIVFSSNHMAQYLCKINNWVEQEKKISINALEIGLFHHELPVVEASLESLEGDLRIHGNRMLMQYIRSNWSTFQDRNSFNRLLHVAQDFVTRLIDSKTHVLTTDRSASARFSTNILFSDNHVGQRSFPIKQASVDIMQLMKDLTEVREIEFYLNHRQRITIHPFPLSLPAAKNLKMTILSENEITKARDELWNQLHDDEIVRRCLLSGEISAALSFLAARRLRRTSSQTTVSNLSLEERSLYMYHVIDGNAEVPRNDRTVFQIQEEKNFSPFVLNKSRARYMHGVGFDWFRNIGGRHIYEKLINDNSELFLATLMLRNLGENVSEFIRDVAFQTSRRELRRRLVRHLSHSCGIADIEMSTIHFVRLLESLYPNSCYTSEQQRKWSNTLNGRLPLWEYNWVGKRVDVNADNTMKQWPPNYNIATQLTNSNAFEVVDDVGKVFPVSPLAPKDGLDERTRPGVVREISRGVGCGYIVKIDLSTDLLDETGKENSYDTDDSESDDETLLEEKYMNVAPPVRGKNKASELIEKFISCGDVDDLGQKTRSGHQPGAAQHIVARDSVDTSDRGSGYYNRKGKANGSGSHHKMRREKYNQNHIVSEFRDRKCQLCVMHRPAAPMVSWLRAQCTRSDEGKAGGSLEGLTPLWMPWVDDGAEPEENGYLYITLAWAHSWSKETRERILIERGRSTPNQLLYLPYLVAHNDWRNVSRWIHNVPLDGGYVNHFGDLVIEDNSSVAPVVLGLYDTLKGVFVHSTRFMKEIMTTEFAKRGVFLLDIKHLSSNSISPRSNKRLNEKYDFKNLMRLLCKCGMLFSTPGEKNISRGNSLSLENLLPFGSPSPFHKFFIKFCIDKGFLHILREYLDHYNLGMATTDLNALDINAYRPWAKLLLTGRIGGAGRSEIFEAAIHNGLYCVHGWTAHEYEQANSEAGEQTPLQIMVRSNRPLMAIGTLMYAPLCSLAEALMDGEDTSVSYDKPWKIHRKEMSEALKAWPSLHRTVFYDDVMVNKTDDVHNQIDESLAMMHYDYVTGNILSWKRDVSLFDLLSDTVPFSVDSMFSVENTEESVHGGNSHKNKHFSSVSFADEAYIETRDAGYYLSKGWPMQAFHHMFAKNNEKMHEKDFSVAELPAEYLKSALKFEEKEKLNGLRLHLNRKSISLIRKISRQSTLYNLRKPSVLAASSCFLDLCGLENVRETLRVDAEAATRIYEYRLRTSLEKQNENSLVSNLEDDILHNVAELFISFPEEKDADDLAVNKALTLLGEATRDLVGDVTNTDSGAVLAWKLVSVFCRVHGLKTSIALLQELARRNDCITFLHEAQRERFMPNEIVDIVLNNFTDLKLRDHVYIVAQNMATLPSNPSNSFIEEADAVLEGQSNMEDIFDILFECAKKDSPGVALLDTGLRMKSPLLAILATCFNDGTLLLDCLVTWLAVQDCCKDISLDWLPWSTNLPSNTASPNPEPVIKLTTVIGRHNCSYEDLQFITSWLCRKNEFSVLRTAFRIFDPSNVLVDFLLFYECFKLRQYEIASSHMNVFVKHIKRTDMKRNNVGDVLMAKQIAEDEIKYLLDAIIESGNTFQCEQLLGVLAKSKFSNIYVQLHNTFAILQRVRISYELSEKPVIVDGQEISLQDFGVWSPADKVLNLLINIQWFEEARNYANSGLHDLDQNAQHRVTRAEVDAMLDKFRNTFLWNIETEKTLFWERCMTKFRINKYPESLIAKFFEALPMVTESATNNGISEPAKTTSEGISPCERISRLLSTVTLKSGTKKLLQVGNQCKNHIDYHKVKPVDIVKHFAKFFVDTVLDSYNHASKTGAKVDEWATDDLEHYVVNVAKAPRELGTEILKTMLASKRDDHSILASETNILSQNAEADLMILAHYCHVQACNVDGINLAINYISERSEVYAKYRNYEILVKLILRTQEYERLEGIFDIISKQNLMPLFVAESVENTNDVGFKYALEKYVRSNHSRDIEHLVTYYRQFQMNRETGELLRNKALQKIKYTAMADEEEALLIAQLFQEAANYFLKEDCYQQSFECIKASNRYLEKTEKSLKLPLSNYEKN